MANTYLTDLEVKFIFGKGDEIKEVIETFGCFDGSLGDAIDEFIKDKLEILNDDLDEDEWEFNEQVVVDYDDEYSDPADFSDLNSYGGYAGYVEEFGEAYHLRYKDIGELTGRQFQDSYRGCWDSVAKYVENYVDDCMELDETSKRYFHYEKFGCDLMVDQSQYDGNEGTHIFCD